MSWRDLPFDSDSHLCVFAPITPEAIDQALRSFRAWSMSPRSLPYRRYRSGIGGRWRRIRRGDLVAHVDRSIVRVPGSPRIEEFERLARTLGHDHFGALLLVGADSIAISLSHRFADGVAGIIEVTPMMRGLAVEPQRMTRFPLWRALLHTNQLSLAAFRAGRAYLRDYDSALDQAPVLAPGRVADEQTVVLSDFSFSSRELAQLVAGERRLAGGEPLTTSAALIALTFRAMRGCLHDAVDLPAGVIIGLRRHLPDGLSTRGNFVLPACVGTLKQRPWTAREVRDHVLPRVADPRAVTAFAVTAISEVKRTLKSMLTRPAVDGGERPQFRLSIVTGGIGMGADDYISGQSPRPGLVMLRRGAAIGPHCTITVTSKDYIVTTVDDSGTLDLSRLAASFRRELSAFTGRDPAGDSE